MTYGLPPSSWRRSVGTSSGKAVGMSSGRVGEGKIASVYEEDVDIISELTSYSLNRMHCGS